MINKEYIEKKEFKKKDYKIKINTEYGFIKYQHNLNTIFRTRNFETIEEMKKKEWYDVICIITEYKQLNFFDKIN